MYSLEFSKGDITSITCEGRQVVALYTPDSKTYDEEFFNKEVPANFNRELKKGRDLKLWQIH